MVGKAVTRALQLVVPAGMKRKIVGLGFNLDRARFQQLATKYLFAPDMKLGLQFLAERGFQPRTIIDIGAFEGAWAEMALDVWPSARMIMVEPNADKAPILRKRPRLKDAVLIDSLLGADEGRDVCFHVMEAGSSVFAEQSPLERTDVTLRQRTLDSVLEGLDPPDFIKIDVQGYELEVLKGGAKAVANAGAILIELSLIDINEGAPLLDECLAYMRTVGFVAYDIFEFHRRPLDGALNQLDILFVPEGSPLRSDKRHWA